MCESSSFNRWKCSDSPERWSSKHTINFSKGLHSIIVLYYWHPRWEINCSLLQLCLSLQCSTVHASSAHHCAAFHNVKKCDCWWAPIQLFPLAGCSASQPSAQALRGHANSTNLPTAATLAAPGADLQPHLARRWQNTSGRTALCHWAEERELLLLEHLAVGVSKSTFDPQPALSAHQTFSCSTKFDFQRRWKIFVTELLQCCQFNCVTHCRQTVAFLWGALCGFQSSEKDCCSSHSPKSGVDTTALVYLTIFTLAEI